MRKKGDRKGKRRSRREGGRIEEKETDHFSFLASFFVLPLLVDDAPFSLFFFFLGFLVLGSSDLMSQRKARMRRRGRRTPAPTSRGYSFI